MKIDIRADADEAALQGARLLAEHIMMAVAGRGHASVAVSGGHTPWAMLRSLAERKLPWRKLRVFQVDERECPEDSDDRNYKHLKSLFPRDCEIHPMPVEDTEHGTEHYAQELQRSVGAPPVFDIVHLGLGPDGHTASLVPGDPALEITDHDVAWTEPYQGHRRMTLTYPAIDRARFAFWLVTGKEKQKALAGLMAGDKALPATRVRTAKRLVISDKDAAAKLDT